MHPYAPFMSKRPSSPSYVTGDRTARAARCSSHLLEFLLLCEERRVCIERVRKLAWRMLPNRYRYITLPNRDEFAARTHGRSHFPSFPPMKIACLPLFTKQERVGRKGRRQTRSDYRS